MTTVLSQMVDIFGTPTNFAGWVLLYVMATLLFAVIIVLVFSLPLMLYKR